MATEDPIAPVAAPAVAEDLSATPDVAAVRTKNAKEPKVKKAVAAKKPRSSQTHPTYLEMIGEAISSLKERTGSSQYAIAKFVEVKHKAKLPPNFKKLLLVQLKKLTAAAKLTKVKNSYKLAGTAKKPATATAKPKPAIAAAKLNAKVAAQPKVKAALKIKSPAKVAKPKAARSATVAKTSAKDAPAIKAVKPKTAAKPKPLSAPKRAAAAKPKVRSVKKIGKSPATKAAPKKVKK